MQTRYALFTEGGGNMRPRKGTQGQMAVYFLGGMRTSCIDVKTILKI